MGRGHKKASDEQILLAYGRHGSCRKAAAELGMGAQAVHERLVRLGVDTRANVFTEGDRVRLLELYPAHADAGTLDVLAQQFGRTKAFLCRQAGKLRLTSKYRSRPYASEHASFVLGAWRHTHGHPRGMAGKSHSDETVRRLSAKSRAMWAAMSEGARAQFVFRLMVAREARSGLGVRRTASWRGSWRQVGEQRCYFRSRWEANYARYLEHLVARGSIDRWEHEPHRFWFEETRGGARTYLPDFRVTTSSGVSYHEVKGWMDARSLAVLSLMEREYPNVTIKLIDAKAYSSLEAEIGLSIDGWEFASETGSLDGGKK